MNPQDAKMKSLDSIINWADAKLMGKAKPKNAPAAVQPPMAPDSAGAQVSPADELDPEMARQLMQAYEDENGDDLQVAQAVPMA